MTAGAARRAEVAVVGVGGAGVNAVSRLGDAATGARLVAADTSAQTLARAAGAIRVPLSAVTRGLGTGRDPRLGAAAALAAERELRAALAGADLVCVVAGMAGGTGGGGAPEVARLARSLGAIVVGFAVCPFGFEAARHKAAAARACRAFSLACDTLVEIDNGRALALAGRDLPVDVALRVADDLLRQAVQGLSVLAGGGGWIEVDLALLRRVLTGSGPGCLALGVGRGPSPARAAMAAALACPLADMGALDRAGAVLVQVSGGRDLAVADTAAAVALLGERLDPGCALHVGAGLEPALAGAAEVTVVGTRIADAEARREADPLGAREDRRRLRSAARPVQRVG